MNLPQKSPALSPRQSMTAKITLLNKDKRPSVLAKLHELVQAAAELPGKVRHKEQERGL